MNRVAHVDEGPDAGITIVELMVTAVIGLLLASLMAAMFLQITRSTTNANLTKDATAIAWTVSDELTRVIRQGTQVATSSSVTQGAVVAGSTPTSLVIDSYVDSVVTAGQARIAPTQVTFTVDPASGNLLEKRQAAVLDSGYFRFTGAVTNRLVNGPILTTGTGEDALFVYWKGTDAAPVQIVPTTGGLTNDQAAQVTAITVNVTVRNELTTGADPVRLTNKVTMPNVAILNGGY
jgi:hypothetical protein